MRRVLERDGIDVLEAENGEEALRAIEDARPDAVVLDLRLPDLPGQEVARRVRAHADPAVARTPLLACSASVQPEVRSDAIAAGCDDFEPKPFQIGPFPGRIRTLIEVVRERRG